MKSSRVLFGSVLVALAGLAFAAEPSVIVVDKSMNAEVVVVQSLQSVDPVDLQVLKITAPETVIDFALESEQAVAVLVGHPAAVELEPERLCRVETSELNRGSLTAAVIAERSNSEVQKLTATSVKTFKI